MDNLKEVISCRSPISKNKSLVFHVFDFNFFCMYFLYNDQMSMISASILDMTTSSKPIQNILFIITVSKCLPGVNLTIYWNLTLNFASGCLLVSPEVGQRIIFFILKIFQPLKRVLSFHKNWPLWLFHPPPEITLVVHGCKVILKAIYPNMKNACSSVCFLTQLWQLPERHQRTSYAAITQVLLEDFPRCCFFLLTKYALLYCWCL